MFVHSGQLDHVLEPRAYFDEAWFEREQRSLFGRNWNFFCLADDVARPGDRFAREICGIPVVVQNDQGTLHALKNVCAHRHSQMVPNGASHDNALRCQIHGWEYGCDGHLSKLPDGRSFKGLKAADYCLKSFRVERFGQFVFVNLDYNGPTFSEHLGSFADEFGRFFSNVRHINTWTTEHPVNWKIIVENAVESYHVPMVHPETFADYRPEEEHDHRLEPSYTRYGDLLPYAAEKSLEATGFRLYTKWLIKNPSFQRFVHVHLYPNLLLYFGDIYSSMAVLEPLGPQRTRYTLLSFVPTEIHWGGLGKLAQNLSMVLFVRMFKKILREDMERWPPVQSGLLHSNQRGILSAREERVYAFQRYVSGQVQNETGAGINSQQQSSLEPVPESEKTHASAVPLQS